MHMPLLLSVAGLSATPPLSCLTLFFLLIIIIYYTMTSVKNVCIHAPCSPCFLVAPGSRCLAFPAFAAVIALQLETFDQPEFNSL